MRNLLRPPDPSALAELDKAMAAIQACTSLSTLRERELPYAVRDLSRLLTQERSAMAQPYWISKRFMTAYCRYFLPWNLVRLTWLLPGLDIRLGDGDAVLDLGSGPLTVPLALWIARPELRSVALTVVCADVAPGPMHLGRDIFLRLAGDSPWKIVLKRGPADQTLRGFAGKAALITAANVLNELRADRDNPLEARLAAFTRLVAARLAPQGRFLSVEPGTRLGGKLASLTRQAAFASRMVPLAPCPHWRMCPMLDPQASGWCHFSHPAAAAPAELTRLTARAKLEKHSLSLSCLFLRPAPEDDLREAEARLPAWDDQFLEDEAEDATGEEWGQAFALVDAAREGGQHFVRILSDPIAVPGLDQPARYACSAKGLALVHGAARLPSGAALAVRWPDLEIRDPKTGALILHAAGSATRETARENGLRAPGEPGAREIQGRRPDRKPGEAGRQSNRPQTRREASPDGRRGASNPAGKDTNRNQRPHPDTDTRSPRRPAASRDDASRREDSRGRPRSKGKQTGGSGGSGRTSSGKNKARAPRPKGRQQ